MRLTDYDQSKHPDIDSSDNLTYRDVIGNKDDTSDGGSLVSILRRVEGRLNNASKVYPTLANGVVVTGGVGAWVLGDAVEVIPADTITSNFLIYWVKIEEVTLNDTYEVVLYKGDTDADEIGRFRTSRDDIYPQVGDIAISTEIIPANNKISAKVANKSGGSEAVTISIHYVIINI